MGQQPAIDVDFVRDLKRGALTSDQAKAFAKQEPAVIQFQLLELSALMRVNSAHVPPSSRPPWEKGNKDKKCRKKKRGAKEGHEGHCRPKPERIDRQVEHQLPSCPDCGGKLKKTGRQRKRYVEDIPANLKAEVTEHTIHRDWCPCCKKQVEPVVVEAMPACMLGNQAVTFSAFLHFGIGISTRQVVDVLNGHLQLPISDGGMTDMWHRLAKHFIPWYERIKEDCLSSAVLNADETGWHLNGDLVWLWCFCTLHETYYAIEDHRDSEALCEFLVEEYKGVLVTDFWRVYEKAKARMHQKCWAHLLRDVKEVDKAGSQGEEWGEFAKKLKRIFTDAVRLSVADNLGTPEHNSKVCCLHTRLADLAVREWTHVDAYRLAKRLAKYRISLLTFVEIPGVPATNNRAEREIRPAVLMRKVSYGSESEKGMETRGILMSIFRTLKNRNLDALAETRKALETLLKTGKLPPLPVQQAEG